MNFNKYKKILFIIISIIIFYSCEQPLEEEEFPYEMKLVIRGILEPDELIDDIYIGRTLPVGVPFNEDFANLDDAVGAVVSDGIYYPLRHLSEGKYTTDSLVAKRGKSYYLVVQYQDKSITSETFVPLMGEILQYRLQTSMLENGEIKGFMVGTVLPEAGESYAATWIFVNTNGNVSREAETFVQVTPPVTEQVNLNTDDIPQHLLNNPTGDLGIRIYVYDSAFYEYYHTQSSGQTPDAIFGQPGSNIKWNIKGEGIGMFIGRNDTILVLP